MRFIKWSKANAVFVPEIDDEHRMMYKAGDELLQALRAAAPQFQIDEILHRLIACTEDHFTHEERLMRTQRYRALDWHKQQHDTARKRMRHLVPLIEAGDPDAGMELVEFLSHWFKDHTGLTDRMMGAYLRNQERARIA